MFMLLVAIMKLYSSVISVIAEKNFADFRFLTETNEWKVGNPVESRGSLRYLFCWIREMAYHVTGTSQLEKLNE